ncbi:MAG TPA: glycosyltransferase family 39 protein [Thermoanaerobaculia bacterium]|nr:glycosyltransferase family 39 protein [Thermoanaerobaculia bacterium]
MSRRIPPAEWLLFSAVVLTFFLLRLPLFREPGLRLGWHSDAAAFGLIAREMYEGEFRLFWYGQSYMGTLTSAFGAVGGLLVAPFGVTPAVGPLALRIGTAIEWVLMMSLYWLGLRIAFGPAVAILTTLLLTTGPDWFFHSQPAPRGGEMLLLLSAAVFAVAARGLERRRDWLIFGVLSGIGWWMHQGIVFTIGAALLVAALRSPAWAILRSPREQRRWPPLVRVMNVVLLVLVGAAVVRDFWPRFPALFLYNALAETVAAWVLFRAGVALMWDARVREAIHFIDLRRALLFAAGFVTGYAPVIVGRLSGATEGTYGFSAPLQTLPGVVAHLLRTLRSDFWILIGASATPLGVTTTICLLALLLASLVRHRVAIRDFLLLRPGTWGPRAIAGATLLLCAAFWVGSTRAYGGAVRYIMPALPMLFAFALAEAARWWQMARPMRIAAAAVVSLLVIGYAVQTLRLVDDITAARAEGRFFTGAGFRSGPTFDPRPVTAAITRGGYEVCYADYSIAMMLEWILDRRVTFLSYNSVEPRRALARRLSSEPSKKCFVDREGRVRPWNPAEHDDSIRRRARERLLRLAPHQSKAPAGR